jgi:hypothetical protein
MIFSEPFDEAGIIIIKNKFEAKKFLTIPKSLLC